MVKHLRRLTHARNWKMETRNWKLETRNSKLGIGSRKVQFPFSIFHFPFSIFHFPVSCSTQCLTNRRLIAIFLALIGVCCSEKPVCFELLKTLTPLLSMGSQLRSLHLVSFLHFMPISRRRRAGLEPPGSDLLARLS